MSIGESWRLESRSPWLQLARGADLMASKITFGAAAARRLHCLQCTHLLGERPRARRGISLALLLLSIVVVPLRAQKTEHDTSLLLTRAADVHDLPGNLAAASTVHLFATITYYDPAEQIMFVQDQSGGVSVTSDKPSTLK
jgi:hypothetical protein